MGGRDGVCAATMELQVQADRPQHVEYLVQLNGGLACLYRMNEPLGDAGEVREFILA